MIVVGVRGCRTDRSMAQDIADLLKGRPLVQQPHGKAVPQRMGPCLAPRRNETRPPVGFAKGLADGLGRCQRRIWRADPYEKMTSVSLAPAAHPGNDGFADIHGNGQVIQLPILASNQHTARVPVDIVKAYRDDFLRPQAQAGHQQQHRVIAQLTWTIALGGFKQPSYDTGFKMAGQAIWGVQADLGMASDSSRVTLPLKN